MYLIESSVYFKQVVYRCRASVLAVTSSRNISIWLLKLSVCVFEGTSPTSQ